MDWNSIFDNTVSAAFGIDAIIYALAAIGLNVHFGYTGLVNFGQVAFAAMGAYGVAFSVTYMHWPIWVGVGVGLGMSVVLALLLGIPTLRLRADYLAIVTIAAGEIVRLIVRAAKLRNYTGGSAGLSEFSEDFYDPNPFHAAVYRFGPLHYRGTRLWAILVGWGLVLLMTLLVWALMRSPWGRVLKAIREDEDAARSLGKNAYWYKMQSLILGGAIGALAGVMFAVGKGSVQPDNYGTAFTFFAYAALILGGTATTWGPVVGAMMFWALLAFTENFLNQAVDNDVIPSSFMTTIQVGQVRFILVGVGLVLLMIFRPQGVFGDKRQLALDE